MTDPAWDEAEHLIEAVIGDPSGPTLIVVGSLHGNEPAGATALEQVADTLIKATAKVAGRVYFLRGNGRALQRSVRYIDSDLNRAWTNKNMAAVGTDEIMQTSEGRELTELDQLLDSILITARSEVYVLDLHSTSATGPLFATVGDTLRNREFAKKFPVNILLGIEEQLEGTMLEYLSSAGAVTLGFEGGSHFSPETVANHTALVWLALVNTGLLKPTDIPGLDEHRLRLAEGAKGPRFIEIRYREAITPEDEFQMRPGFNNFDLVEEGDVLAYSTRGPIKAPESGMIVMPLYQKLGEDGFFVARYIAPFWLWLSRLLRHAKAYRLMPLLPGVKRDPAAETTLIINTRLARFFPLQIFHLLGFRKLRWSEHQLVVSRRKHDTVSPFVSGTNN